MANNIITTALEHHAAPEPTIPCRTFEVTIVQPRDGRIFRLAYCWATLASRYPLVSTMFANNGDRRSVTD